MRVTLAGHFSIDSGRASMHVYLALGMHRAGAHVNIWPTVLDPRGCPDELLMLYARSSPHLDGPVVNSSWHGERLGCIAWTPLFLRTMYESSQPPSGWPAIMNQTRGVIVPSRFVAESFRSSGVTVPIHVVPDGVDPGTYRYVARSSREGITTLVVAALWDPKTWNDRKHLPAAVRAWRLAFADDPTARLILKVQGAEKFAALREIRDRRITVLSQPDQTLGIASVYRQADVLLALGSEGFGLPLIEGMATGLPVIALASEGQKDVCDEAQDLVISVAPAGLEPHRHWSGERCGVRGYPDPVEVAAKLRWVAEHRDEAADMGRMASAWVRRARNVWDYGPAVLTVVDESSRRRRRLRQRTRECVPIVSSTPGP